MADLNAMLDSLNTESMNPSRGTDSETDDVPTADTSIGSDPELDTMLGDALNVKLPLGERKQALYDVIKRCMTNTQDTDAEPDAGDSNEPAEGEEEY